MQSESSSLPELPCQWCSGTIPLNETTCNSCGASRPREELTPPRFAERVYPVTSPPAVDVVDVPENDEEVRARQILKDLDAYVDEKPPVAPGRASDPMEDAIVIIGILFVGGLVGGLAGWFLAPPLLHDFFENVIGVDSDGPEAFRRLGAFIGALLAMLFGALLAVMIRR